MRVLIIIPYFGKWPPWIEYFFQSCRYNPSFSWLIYTDCNIPNEIPKNILFLKKNISDFNNLASRKLGLKIKFQNPYKICDLRPAFGKVFEDYIKDFDFWGYSDLDLIYGNMGHFLSLEVLKKNDVISVRKNYMTGHFALLRNNSYINSLFRKYSNYAGIFENHSKHFAFDERSNVFGRRLLLSKKSKWLFSIYSTVELFANKLRLKFAKLSSKDLIDFTRITKDQANNNKIQLFRKDLVRSDLWYDKKGLSKWEIEWNAGTLTDKTENLELFHFHFIKSKSQPTFKINKWSENRLFFTTEKGISIQD